MRKSWQRVGGNPGEHCVTEAKGIKAFQEGENDQLRQMLLRGYSRDSLFLVPIWNVDMEVTQFRSCT